MKQVIAAGESPPPPGPFSPALRVGEWIFLSGQGGFAPRTGELVAGGIAEQTEQTLRNIDTILQASGASLDDVVSCLAHLTDLGHWPKFNEAYERHFPETKPVRTTVRADLVDGMLVELTVIAHRTG